VQVGASCQLDLWLVPESVAAHAFTDLNVMQTVYSVGLLDRAIGPDRGKAHINRRTGHLAPGPVVLEARKSARFCWVS